MIQFDEHIFEMGWNHNLESIVIDYPCHLFFPIDVFF